jgi:hypothetical protein
MDPIADSKVKESFKKEFPDAQFVKWSATQDYHRVDFVLTDYRLEAFFSKQGELLETHRDLSYNQLPLTVMKELEKNFPDTKFSQIEEISNSSGTKYSLIAETSKRIFKIIATPDGTTSIIERTRKMK